MTKKQLKERMEAHVQESLNIRKEVSKILEEKKINDEDLDTYIRTCTFDKLKSIVDITIPNDTKKIKDLTKGEMFLNPDGGELLQFISLESTKDGKYVIVDAISYNNELRTYFFESDRDVEIV